MNPVPVTASVGGVATRGSRSADFPASGAQSGLAQAGQPQSGSAMAGSAHEFESMAIGEFLQPMFSSVDDTDNLFGGGEAEGILKPMLVTEFAKLMEQKGGLGLEPVIERKMGELSEAKDRRR